MTKVANSEYFIAKAEQCFRLARHVRASHSDPETAAELDAIGNEFMARAVEIDTERDRAETRKQRYQ